MKGPIPNSSREMHGQSTEHTRYQVRFFFPGRLLNLFFAAWILGEQRIETITEKKLLFANYNYSSTGN